MKHYSLVFLGSLIFFSCQSQPQNGSATDYQEAIDRSTVLIDSLMQARQVPGVGISVSIDGEIIWTEGFGFADLENQSPVVGGVTKFRIGSVSKPLTAAALARLYEAGMLDFDADVRQYAPQFPEKRYPFTVKQTAGHLAGIRHYRGREFLSAESYPSVNASLKIFQDDTLLHKPGSVYRYSSYGWNLLSAVAEGASGKPFLELMDEEVFTLLDLQNTTPDYVDQLISHRTRFYIVSNSGEILNAPYVDNSYKWAGGGFLSTTEDLIKFAEAHRNPGYLKQETLDLLIASQIKDNGEKTNYGIGWRSGEDDYDRGWYGHTGGSVGGITVLRIYPEEALVIAMVSNSSNMSYGKVPDAIVNLFLQEP